MVGDDSHSCDHQESSSVPLDLHHLTTAQLGLMVDQVRDWGFSTKFHQAVTEKHVVVAHVFLPDGLLLAFSGSPLNGRQLNELNMKGNLESLEDDQSLAQGCSMDRLLFFPWFPWCNGAAPIGCAERRGGRCLYNGMFQHEGCANQLAQPFLHAIRSFGLVAP